MTGAQDQSILNGQPTLRFVDTHTHLDDDAFLADVDQVIAEAIAQGVTTFVNIGYEPARWKTTISLANRFPSVSYSLGMHPQHADDWNVHSADVLRRLLVDRRPVAIGEVGIDLFRGETNVSQQLRCFDDQLDLAVAHKLPVVVHMRSAQSEILHHLNGRTKNPQLLFHSFDGDEVLTQFVLEHATIVGVGGLATRSKSVTIRQQLKRIPLTQMVLETDSPYLVPTKVRGSRNMPKNIPVIAEFLADLKQISVIDVANTTTTNAERFFGKLGDV